MKRFFIICFAFSISLFVMSSERSLKITKRYLNFPVSHKVDRAKMTLESKENSKFSFVIRLASDDVDYWVFKDMSDYYGQKVTLSYDCDMSVLNRIYESDEPAGAENMYKEPKRPQFHFTSRRGWINDPNGLIYYDGEYHLFYQHNPYENEWQNMHWGHAVSHDLIHWEELPDALYPDTLGLMFSGSAVIDYGNTSGFGSKNNPAMVLAYTSASSTHQVQCIAYSLDHGRTFIKYDKNPVISSNKNGNL